MNKQQALTLIYKVKNIILKDIINVHNLQELNKLSCKIKYTLKDNGKIRSITYNNKGASIIISEPYHNREISVVFQKTGMFLSYDFTYLPFFFAYFSKAYRETRKFFKIIEKLHKQDIAEHEKIKEKENFEKFNNIYGQMFQDEINNMLLGEKDD